MVFVILCVFLIEFHKTNTQLVLGEPNVCDDQGKLYCCYNHYEEDNRCKECQDGTFTDNGKTCENCPSDHFGNQCRYTCKCSSLERCDSVHGCIHQNSKLSTEGISMLNTDKNKTQQYLDENKREEDENPTSLEQNVAIGSLIIFFLCCIGSLQLLNYRRKRKNTKSQNVSESEGNRRNQANNDSNVENFYHEIDDVSCPVSEAIVRNSYMSINSDMSVEHNDGESLVDNGYLVPIRPSTPECKPKCEAINPTITNMIYYQNKNDDGDAVMEDEDDENKNNTFSSANKTEEHLHPYRLLIEKRDIHDYVDN